MKEIILLAVRQTWLTFTWWSFVISIILSFVTEFVRSFCKTWCKGDDD